MEFKYDRKADAAYIRLLKGVQRAFGHKLDDARFIDFGADNQPIGIELLGVSRGVDTHGLPERRAIERLLAAHKIKVFA